MWGDVAFSLTTLLILGILAGIALVSKALRSAHNITVDIWVIGTVVLTFIIFGAQGLIRSILRSRMGEGIRFHFSKMSPSWTHLNEFAVVRNCQTCLNSTPFSQAGTLQPWRLPMTLVEPVKRWQ